MALLVGNVALQQEQGRQAIFANLSASGHSINYMML